MTEGHDEHRTATTSVTTTERLGLRSESVRRSNLSTILRLLHLEGPLSRTAIGQRTGLTRTAVGTLVGDLVDMAFVDEVTPERDGTRGRPSPIVRPMSGENAVIGVDLLVDSMGVGAIGLGGITLRSVRRERRRQRQSVERTVEDAIRAVEQVRATLPADARVLGLGIAVAGTVASVDQRLVLAPNLGWADVDLRGLFQASIPDLDIHVANEADLGALAESRRGSVAGRSDVLYLSGEVGVGGGIISGDELLRGSGGFAGEVGHLPVNPSGRRCGCGALGCLETEIGEKALLARAGLPADGGRAAVDELLRLAAEGHDDTMKALSLHAHWLAIGITGLVNVLNVEAVVLGGLLGAVFPHIEEQLLEEFGRRALPTVRDTTIVASTLGEDATMLGAGELAWDRVLGDLTAAAGV
ncbi:MAG: ROK family transcriptional regulator [Actinomycetota bacterium]